jgi:Ca2+-binding RTX toxin-like protein
METRNDKRGYSIDVYVNVKQGSPTNKTPKEHEKMATFTGNNNANTLTGTTGGDAMFGMGGNDTVSGGKGNDYLMGNLGVDRLFGGDGNDKMNLTTEATAYSHTNKALELMDGGAGIDNAHIDAFGSSVDGLGTHTVIVHATGGGKYGISLDSGAGFGSAPIATTAGVESFTLRADGPVMSFVGNIGSTGPAITVTATNGNDIFCGGGENSTVNLLGGNDRAVISGGKDTVTLGDGADTVDFSFFYNGARNGVVTDFKVGEDDLNLDGWNSTNAPTVTEDAGGTWIKGGDDSLYLAGVQDFDINPYLIA